MDLAVGNDDAGENNGRGRYERVSLGVSGHPHTYTYAP